MKLLATLVVLRVQDMDRAVAFYRDGLGMAERFQTPVFSEVDAAGTIVALQAGGDGSYRRSSMSLAVEEMRAACDAVVAAGGSIRNEPVNVSGDLWSALVVDTEGNGFGLSSHQDALP